MMRAVKSVLLTIVLGFSVSACAGYQPVDTTKPAVLGNGVSISPKVQWASVSGQSSGATLWTIDGIGLDQLHSWTGVKSGAAMLAMPGQRKEDQVLYQSTMLPNDVADGVATALSKMGYAQVRTANLAPAPFGTARGFRFDVTLSTGNGSSSGLLMKGICLASQRDGLLDVILYLAPAEYYYDRHAPTVEEMFASVQVAEVSARR